MLIVILVTHLVLSSNAQHRKILMFLTQNVAYSIFSPHDFIFEVGFL